MGTSYFINEWQKRRISNLIIETFLELFLLKIVILGFAFKSNTNDTRYSPAINIVRDLLENGANIYIHDLQVLKIKFL